MEGIYMKKIVFTFGRFNPPTTGHLLLANKVKNTARKLGADHKIYGSSTNDKKKNPLSPIDKLLYMKKFLKGFNVYVDKKTNTPFNVLKQLSDQGYTDVTMVVGSDRVQDFKKSISRYVGPDKEYKFDKFNVISAGERDPDAEGVTGMSASKMRAAAADGNFDAFKLGVPSHVSDRDAMGIFKAVRRGMGVKGKIQESWFNYDEFMEFAENYTQLNEEAIELNELSVRARRKMAKAARRTAKLRARKRKIKEKRRKGKIELTQKANKQAIMKVKKKLIRGMNWNDLSFMQREKIDAKVKKKKVLIARISKRLMPNMQKAEQERLKKVRSRMTAKTPAQAIAPANESLDSAFETFLAEEPKKQMATDRAKEKEINRGQGASDSRQRDTARKKGERAAAKVGGKAKWSDLMLVRGRNNKKVMLITAADFHETDHDPIVQKGKVTRGSAGAAAQEDDWKWTETAKSLIHKPKDEVKTKGAKSEQEAGAKGGAKQPETPAQQQASQAQADLASLNVREKEMQVATIEKEFQAQQDVEQQQTDFETNFFVDNAGARLPRSLDSKILTEIRKGGLGQKREYSTIELPEPRIPVGGDEGKQLEFAFVYVSLQRSGMSDDDIEARLQNEPKLTAFNEATLSRAKAAIKSMENSGFSPEQLAGAAYSGELKIAGLRGGEPKTDNVIMIEEDDPMNEWAHTKGMLCVSMKKDGNIQASNPQGPRASHEIRMGIEDAIESGNFSKKLSKSLENLLTDLSSMPSKIIAPKNIEKALSSEKNYTDKSKVGDPKYLKPAVKELFINGDPSQGIRDESNGELWTQKLGKDISNRIKEEFKSNPEMASRVLYEQLSGRRTFSQEGTDHRAAADVMITPYGLKPITLEYCQKLIETGAVNIRISQKGSGGGLGRMTLRVDVKGKVAGSPAIKNVDQFLTNVGITESTRLIKRFLSESESESEYAGIADTDAARTDIADNIDNIASTLFMKNYDVSVEGDLFEPFQEEGSKEFNTVTINGKKKKIPITSAPEDFDSAIDESFRMLTEPDVLDTLANRLMSKGMDNSKAYAIATSSLQKRGILKKGTHDLVDEDYLMALPDYPIQKGELTKNLFDKTLDRDSGWELGDPPNPLELHDPNYKFKDSSLHGKGSFASKDIKEDEVIGLYLMNLLEEEVAYQRTDFCRLTNHSHKNQNVRMEEMDGNLYAVATRDIKEDEEILMDYFTVFDVVGEETQVIEEVLRWTAGYDDMEIGPDMSGDLMDELQHFIDIGDCPKVYEEGGAGEWGTKKLRDKYIKKTPFMSIDETFSSTFKGV